MRSKLKYEIAEYSVPCCKCRFLTRTYEDALTLVKIRSVTSRLFGDGDFVKVVDLNEV